MADARLSDHLANERTFLAWLRTAFAMISLGVALTKFVVSQEAAGGKGASIGTIQPIVRVKFVGLGIILTAVISTFLAGVLYVVRSKEIESGEFLVRRRHWWVLIICAVIMVWGAFAAYWVME